MLIINDLDVRVECTMSTFADTDTKLGGAVVPLEGQDTLQRVS